VHDDFRVIEGEYLRDLLEQPVALQHTLMGLTVSAPLDHLARRLAEGEFRRIVLTGMGSSFHALHPINFDLIQHGFTSIMVETSELLHYATRLLDPTTLIIVVSQSGQSAEVVRLLEINCEANPIIAITNTETSPLALKSAAVILTRAGREFSVSCKTYVCTLLALQWLASVLCQRDPEPARDESQQVPSAVAAYLQHWKEHVALLLEVLKDIRHLFIVGRGASLAAVGTGGLIIKESDHFHAEGMSSAAFRHGPFEMLDEKTFVLVFAGDEKTRDLNARLVEHVRQQGARAEMVGEETSVRAFRLPKHSTAARPILEILPVQMITLALAALAGREAGKFERAAKITTTE